MNITQTQNVVRRFRIVGNYVITFYTFIFEYVELTLFRNYFFVRIVIVYRGDNQTTFIFGFFIEGNDIVDFSQDCRFFRTTCFEQVRNARQIIGDVFGIVGFLRNTRQGVIRVDLYVIFQLNNRFIRQEVLRWYIGIWDQNVVILSINDFQCRTQIFIICGTFCGIQNYQRRQIGQFVGLTRNGLVVDYVSKAYKIVYFGDNRYGVRVLVCNGFVVSNLFVIVFRQYRIVRYFVVFFSTIEFVDQFQFSITGSDNQFIVGVYNRFYVVEFDVIFVFYLDVGFSSRTRCRIIDVERTYGQLCIRFIDGLCRDNIDCFIFVDDVVTRQVTIVVVRIYIKVGVIRYNRTYFNRVDRVFFQQVILLFVQQRVARNEDISSIRFQNVFSSYTIQYAIAQRFFNVIIFDNRSYYDIFMGIIIVFGNYQVLRYVNQTTSQVIGVRSFQCGIRQIFTSIVGGDEVLEYVQIFTEVRGDWRFDDGVIRFRYQITYISKLTNLCRRITRIGVGYYVDVVEGNLFFFLIVTVNYGFSLQVIYYRFGYTIVRRSLDIDNFVVAFVRSYQIRLELFLNFSNFCFCFGDDFVFFFRDDYVIDINRCIRTRCIGEVGVYDLVRKNNGRFQIENAVVGVQYFGDCFFIQRLVDDGVRQIFRYNYLQNGTVNSRVFQVGFRY